MGILKFLDDHHFAVLLISVFVLLAIGTLFYHIFEGWRFLDSLYFSVTTVTTIGYGDFTPKTDLGKLFTIIYVLFGIGIIFGFINELEKRRLNQITTRLAQGKLS